MGRGLLYNPSHLASMPIEFTAHVIKKTGAESKVDFLNYIFFRDHYGQISAEFGVVLLFKFPFDQ